MLRLPRGLTEAAQAIIEESGSRFELEDQRSTAITVEYAFDTVLFPTQQAAVDALKRHEQAVLVAPTGAGKTVIACAVIAEQQVPTLILVYRTTLVEQWRDQLMTHLKLSRKQVGRVAATSKASGIVDIATLQAVARRGDISKLIASYGLVIVDECHHLPARSFEIAIREAPTRRWLGLTATPYRSDGLEAIITMQCGPVRHEIALADTASAALARRLVVHDTKSTAGSGDIASIQDVFRALVEDDGRTRQIAGDIIDAVQRGRNVLVLTQWTEHLDAIANSLNGSSIEPLILKGGLGKKARAAILTDSTNPTLGANSCLRPVPTSEKDSIARRWTPFFSPSRSRSGDGSCSTSAGYCGPPTARPRSKSMTTSIPEHSSERCTANGSPATKPSDSTHPQDAERNP